MPDDRPTAAPTGAGQGRVERRWPPSRTPATAVTDCPSRCPRRDRPAPPVTCSAVSARTSSQAVTPDGMALTAFGRTSTLPTVARASCRRAAARTAHDRAAARASGRRGRPAGWCRRGRPGRRGRPASGRAAGSCRRRRPTAGPTRSTSPRPCSMCSSTKAPTRRSGLVVTAERAPGRAPARGHRLRVASRRPRRAGRAPCPGRGDPGEQPRSGAGQPEPGPLLVDEADDAERPGRRDPRARSRSTAASAEATPSGPSNAPPSGTESRWLPVTTPGRTGRHASGSPHHAHWLPQRSVVTSRPRAGAGGREPLAERGVLRGEREPPVPAGARVPSDLRDLGQQGGDAGHRGRAVDDTAAAPPRPPASARGRPLGAATSLGPRS